MPRHPLTSDSADSLSDRVYSVLVQKARGLPGPIYPLHVGDTYREPLVAARAESQRSEHHPRLHNYAPVQGEPALLDAIVERLEARSGRSIDRELVQVTAGATSGFSVAAAGLLDPGDEVILLSPYWPLIRGIFASRGARAVEVPFWTRLGEPGFDPVAAVAEAITPRTTALYINSPNNPSGRVLDPGAAAALGRLAAAHDLWVLSDEAYDELCYVDRAPPLWSLPELADRTVAAHTLSKSYGLAGARIGWLHGPASAMRVLRGVQTFQAYCAPRPMQLGAVRALREGDAWIEEARRLYAEAGKRAAETVGVPAPEGGTFLFFDASPYLRDGEPLLGFLERCLAAGVLLTPGSASGQHFARWARLCFTAVPPAELDDALRRLAGVLGR
ncbi:MAG: pyridoxal phosphate-dependent aminotransferase [Byssovorax sp.]